MGLMKLVITASMCYLGKSFDTIPDRLWPLTNYALDREVKVGQQTVEFSGPTHYIAGEPKLGYQALSVDEISLNVTLGEEIKNQKEVMLMAMFYWDPKLNKEAVFFQNEKEGFKFKVYGRGCDVYIEGLNGKLINGVVEECSAPKWYTIGAQWKEGELSVSVVEGIQGKDKGKKRLEVKGKDLLNNEQRSIPEGSTLTVGPIPGGGAVSCLRVYIGAVKPEEKMWEDCAEEPYWQSFPDVPGYNPCVERPCQNGGTCHPVNATDYTCRCRPWYSDKNCTTELWVVKQDFRHMGAANLTGKMDPIQDWANLPVRNERECSCQCLQLNKCKSFTFANKLCSLYDDIALNYSGTGTQYFVEQSLLGKV